MRKIYKSNSEVGDYLKLITLEDMRKGENKDMIDDPWSYEEVCDCKKRLLDIPKECQYDMKTDMVTIPYSEFQTLRDLAQENKARISKENKILVKMLLKIYLRLRDILQFASCLAGLVFFYKGSTILTIIAGIVFSLVYILPGSKDDLEAIFAEKIKNFR